jgi:hypothetical protein
MRSNLKNKIKAASALPLVHAVNIDRSKMKYRIEGYERTQYKYAVVEKQLSNGHTLIRTPDKKSGDCASCAYPFKALKTVDTICSYCVGQEFVCLVCFDKNHRVMLKKNDDV